MPQSGQFPLWGRLLVAGLLIGFIALTNNPLVVLQARLGLSPAPLERYLGVKNIFSGMTEGVHQFVHFNFSLAVEANIFSPIVVLFGMASILTWRFPKIDTKVKEAWFFVSFILGSIMVNLFN